MKIDIKHRVLGSVLFSFECDSMKICLEAAVESRADLSGADLACANLACANLAGADLARANLAGANLAGANLACANLAGANLAGADLAGAKEVPVFISAIVPWTICIPASGRVINVGCHSHSPEEWLAFTAEQLDGMDNGASAYMDRIPPVVALAEAYWAIESARAPK